MDNVRTGLKAGPYRNDRKQLVVITAVGRFSDRLAVKAGRGQFSGRLGLMASSVGDGL